MEHEKDVHSQGGVQGSMKGHSKKEQKNTNLNNSLLLCKESAYGLQGREI